MTAFKKWRVGGSRFEKASILGKKKRSSEKIWLPCRLFTLNSVTLAILPVATKLPVDLDLFDAQRS
ncbi:hypothetical protein Scep_007055 [Stephania cephalantha]|uniref:Uncharacterized protein n=1 Tax=Stephania cephalantha TaxID=152367 RepID=A0AAP0PKP6_9MAGN